MTMIIDEGDNLQSTDENTSILSTATEPNGSSLRGPLSPDHRVTVQGIEMTLAQAESLGFVKKTAEGYQELSAADQAALMESRYGNRQEAPEPSFQVSLDPDTTSALNDLLDVVHQTSGQSPVHVVASMLGKPDRLPAALDVAADELGLDKELVLSEAQRVARGIEQGVTEHLRGLGVNPDEFYSYIHQHVDEFTFRQAIVAAVGAGDGRHLQRLVDQYNHATNYGHGIGIDPATGRREDQSDLVEIDGITTTAAVARRLGYRV